MSKKATDLAYGLSGTLSRLLSRFSGLSCQLVHCSRYAPGPSLADVVEAGSS